MWLFFIILGIVQGITEFIPISSSGHLVLLQLLWRQPDLGSNELLFFDAIVHFATLIAVIWVFRRAVLRLIRAVLGYLFETNLTTSQRSHGARQIMLIIIGTIPTAIIGLLLKRQIESSFSSSAIVGINLIVTGVLLFWASSLARQERQAITFLEALIIGVAQGLAIFPGISRSGFTIGTGMILGLRQDIAAEHSFLLAIPAIVGALLVEILGLHAHVSPSLIGPYVVGGFFALATGIISLRILLHVLRSRRLSPFAYYCLAAGIFALFASKYILA